VKLFFILCLQFPLYHQKGKWRLDRVWLSM